MRKGLSGNIHTPAALLVSWKRSAEKKALKKRTPLPGYPVEHRFTSSVDVDAYLNVDKIVCLMCGRAFKSVGNHLLVHNITVRDYQEKYNLPFDRGLSGIARTEALADHLKKRIESGELDLSHLTDRQRQKALAVSNVTRSPYKIMKDKEKIRDAIDASTKARIEKTQCSRGHPYEEGKRRCGICALDLLRKRKGYLPQKVAAKTYADGVCAGCGVTVAATRLSANNKNLKCKQCKLDAYRVWHKKYMEKKKAKI